MSDSKSISAQDVTKKFVDLFNQLLTEDPEACKELLAAGASINHEKTHFICRNSRGKAMLGVLGFVNTALNDLGLPRVAVCREDNDEIVKFIVNEKCVLTTFPFPVTPPAAPKT